MFDDIYEYFSTGLNAPNSGVNDDDFQLGMSHSVGSCNHSFLLYAGICGGISVFLRAGRQAGRIRTFGARRTQHSEACQFFVLNFIGHTS